MFFDESFREIIRILKDVRYGNRRLIKAVSRRHKVIAMRHDFDLEKARSKKLIAGKLNGLYMLDKGTGNFELRFEFDKSGQVAFNLDQDAFDNGDFYEWNIKRLYLINASQAGETLSVIVEEYT